MYYVSYGREPRALQFVFTRYMPDELHDMNHGQCDGQLRTSPHPPDLWPRDGAEARLARAFEPFLPSLISMKLLAASG